MVAMRLAEAGCDVTLLEKERSAFHKVCGEFLSTEAVQYLRSAGVNPFDLGAATIRSVRLSSKHRVIEAALPFTALSLSRRALDAAMIARAAESGCKVRLGVAVDSLEMRHNLWSAQLRTGELLSAHTVFLPTASMIFADGSVGAAYRATSSVSNCIGNWRRRRPTRCGSLWSSFSSQVGMEDFADRRRCGQSVLGGASQRAARR